MPTFINSGPQEFYLVSACFYQYLVLLNEWCAM